MDAELFFARLVTATSEKADDPAPARLKARLYSALVAEQTADGGLCSLTSTKEAGGGLCVFEHIVAAAPVSDSVKAMNPCRVCHARVLGERLDRAPIFWANCPYSEFHRT